jgi:hypothetical protein
MRLHSRNQENDRDGSTNVYRDLAATEAAYTVIAMVSIALSKPVRR